MNRLCRAYLTICLFCLLIIVGVLFICFADFDKHTSSQPPGSRWPKASYVSSYLLIAAERLENWEHWEENKHLYRFFMRLDLGTIYDDTLEFITSRDFYRSDL